MRRSKRFWAGMLGCGCLGLLLAVVMVVLPTIGSILMAPDFREVGGLELVLVPPPGEPPAGLERDLLERTVQVQQARLDGFGARGVELVVVDGGIVARIPAAHDTERLERLLTRRYRLELYEVSGVEPSPKNLTAPPPGTLPLFESSIDPNTGEQVDAAGFLVRSQPVLSGQQVQDADVRTDPFGAPYVHLEFTPEGKRIFCDVTTSSVDKQLPIVIDGTVNSAPVVAEPICGGRASITMAQDDHAAMEARASDLAVALRAGELPVDLEVTEARTVGPAP